MEVQLYEKEIGWNDRCLPNDHIPEYDATKDKFCDIFYRKESAAVSAPAVKAKRVTKGDIRQAYLAAAQDSSKAPIFSSVAAAFDFEHHVGSDPELELQVLRAILQRESLVSKIDTLAHELTKPHVFAGDEPDYEGMNAQMLDLLAQCRDRTLEVVEVTEQWRETVTTGPHAPFVWQNTNYLLKMCRDLDFLAVVKPLVQMLNVQPESIKHNPLMLENTLDQEAFETKSAADDLGNLSAEEKAEHSRKLHEKARLRRAEAVLSREEKIFTGRQGQPALTTSASAPVVPLPGSDIPGVMREGWSANEKTVDTSLDPPSVPSQPQALLPLMGSTGTDWGDRQKDLLTWYDNAQEQLARLKKPYFIRGGSTKSTGRLSVPKREKLQPMQHMPSFALALDRVPTPPQKKLTELLSTSPVRMGRPASGKRRLRAITAPYNANLVPKPEGMDEPPASAGDNVRAVKGKSKPEVKSRYMLPRKVWTEEDLKKGGSKTPTGPETDVVDAPAHPRPMTPSVRNAVSREEFEALKELKEPSEDITIVAASVLILLSDGASLPPDVRWSAFQKQETDGFLQRMDTFEPTNVPDFKLRALRRFLSIDAYNPVELDKDSSAAAKLAVWILRVIAAHPAGGAYIKEVRSSLAAWEDLQSKPRKKLKKKKKKKKIASSPDAGLGSPSSSMRQTEEREHKLLGDIKRASFGIEKNMIQELRSAVRGKIPPAGLVTGLEAVALVLEPRKKPSIETIRNLMVKGSAFEARLKGYDRKQAENLTESAVGRLLKYLENPLLEVDALAKTSRAVATLMVWVRAIFSYAQYNNEIVRKLAEEQVELDNAATKLQGLQRAKIAKKAVSEKREQSQAARTLQNRTRVSKAKKVVAEKRAQREEGNAAARLQGLQRQKVAKKRVEAIRAERARDLSVEPVHEEAVVEEKEETTGDAEIQESVPEAATPVKKEVVVVADEDIDENVADDEDDEYGSEGFMSPPATPGDAFTPGKTGSDLEASYRSDFEFDDDEAEKGE